MGELFDYDETVPPPPNFSKKVIPSQNQEEQESKMSSSQVPEVHKDKEIDNKKYSIQI